MGINGWSSTSPTNVADLRIGVQAAFAAASKRNDERDVARVTTYQTVYGPDMLGRMGTAFDRAWKGLSGKVGDRDSARSKLARRIILHVDRGERDPDRIADLAMLDFLRT